MPYSAALSQVDGRVHYRTIHDTIRRGLQAEMTLNRTAVVHPELHFRALGGGLGENDRTIGKVR